jgi:hypothetical protein
MRLRAPAICACGNLKVAMGRTLGMHMKVVMQIGKLSRAQMMRTMSLKRRILPTLLEMNPWYASPTMKIVMMRSQHPINDVQAEMAQCRSS